MRKAIKLIILAILLGLAYMAWPMLSAWHLKQAIRSGDLAAIEQKVDWPALRASLTASLIEKAGAKPLKTATASDNSANAPAPRPEPSLWQRLKRRYAPGIIGGTVQQTITPAWLVRAYATRENYRRKWRPAVGFAKPPQAFDGTWLADTKLAKFIDSFDPIERIVFTSFTTLEIEVIDRYQPDRHFIVVMQLQGLRWKLAGLRLLPQKIAPTQSATN